VRPFVKTSLFAVVSLVLGLVGLYLALRYRYIGLFSGVAAMTTGAVALARALRSQPTSEDIQMAMVGLILGAVQVLVTLVMLRNDVLVTT